MLLRLRHRAVGGRDHEDGAVHLSSTGDHVLHVVSVTGAVDVSVVTLLRLVLDVRDRDGDAALLLLGRLVDRVERRRLVEVGVAVVQNLGDGSRQRRLAVVDVTDGADVDVRLAPLELRLRHLGPPQDLCWSNALSPSGLKAPGRVCCLQVVLRVSRRDGPVHSPRIFLMISSATLRGTSLYESNCIV